MNWTGYGRELFFPNLWEWSNICLEGQMKTVENFSHIVCSAKNLNWTLPKYKSEALLLESTSSIIYRVEVVQSAVLC